MSLKIRGRAWPILALCVMASGGCARHRIATSFAELENNVKPGQTVYLTSANGEVKKGKLDRITGASGDLNVSGGTYGSLNATPYKLRCGNLSGTGPSSAPRPAWCWVRSAKGLPNYILSVLLLKDWVPVSRECRSGACCSGPDSARRSGPESMPSCGDGSGSSPPRRPKRARAWCCRRSQHAVVLASA